MFSVTKVFHQVSNEYQFYSSQYPYPLNRVLTDGGDFCKPFTIGDPTNVNPGVDNFYIICCTPDEMSKIQSAIEVGAPIAYPDFYSDVFQLMEQAIQFPNSFEGAACVDLCQLIINCINDTPELQQLIAQTSIGAPINGSTGQNSQLLLSEIINNPSGCDNDHLFGMTTGLVDLLDDVGKNILSRLQASANPSGRIGDIIEAIPGIGELPVDDIFQFVESALEDIENGYDAAYTAVLRNDLRCGLFCIAQDDCTLTLEEARDFYVDQLGLPFDFVSVLDFINNINDNAWLGDATVYVMHLIVLQMLIFGGNVTGFDVDKLLQIVQSMFNDPDSDWMTLCNDCETLCYTFDFTTSTEGFMPLTEEGYPDRAVWEDGIGWNQNWSNLRWRCGIYYDLPQVENIVRIELDVDFNPIGATSVMNRHQYFTDGNVNGSIDAKTVTQSGVQTLVYDVDYSSDQLVFNGANGTQGNMGIQDTQIITGMRVYCG